MRHMFGLTWCASKKYREKEGSRVTGAIAHLDYSWKSVSMDFILGFPKFWERSSITAMVGKFSKYAIFVPPKTMFSV